MIEMNEDLIKEIKKEFKDFQNMSPAEQGAYIAMYMQRKLKNIQKE